MVQSMTVETDMIGESDAATLLGVSRRTMVDWRRLEQGPAFYRYPTGAVRYSRADLEAFKATARVEPGRG